jgi:hypothetical protein
VLGVTIQNLSQSGPIVHAQRATCWSAGSLRFPAGNRDAVFTLASDFIISAEDLPAHPYWPKGNSGITIGVGWDLGQHDRNEFLTTWAALDRSTLGKLEQAVHKTGQQARLLIPSLMSVEIPRGVSLDVFRDSLTNDYYPQMTQLFPGAVSLPAEVEVALLSIVFNRGVLLGHDPDWRKATELDRRWEMRRLQDDVRRQDLFAIYVHLGTMKRLWEKTGPRGLLYRRRDEQHLMRPYVDKQLQWEKANDEAKAAGLPPCPK